jgi:chloramphenicol O-acetyltransferase type A
MKTLYNKTPFPTKGWQREETFNFFQSFSQPYFQVHTEIPITSLYHYAKWEGLSVFLAYLHAATEAMRRTENFLLRIEANEVVKYEAVDVSTTVLTDSKTVSFVHLPHHPDLPTFCLEASQLVKEVQKNNKLFNGYNGSDLFHATTLPWFKFHGMEHAYEDNAREAIPKLTFGRLEWRGNQVILPVSVRVHHALVDGYHIHLFLQNMQLSVQAAGTRSAAKPKHPFEKMKSMRRFLKPIIQADNV